MKPEIGNIRSMYEYLLAVSEKNGWESMKKCLPFMREKHAGQFRSGKNGLPYEVHPLSVCLHGLMLGIEEEDVLCCCLLHDVVEDCGVSPEELPVNDRVKKAVGLVSWPGEDHDSCREEYYEGIKSDRTACIVKCLDRCSNLTGMFAAYSAGKLKQYSENTEKHLFPVLDALSDAYGEERLSCLLRYHVSGLLEGAARVMRTEERASSFR